PSGSPPPPSPPPSSPCPPVRRTRRTTSRRREATCRPTRRATPRACRRRRRRSARACRRATTRARAPGTDARGGVPLRRLGVLGGALVRLEPDGVTQFVDVLGEVLVVLPGLERHEVG